MLGVVPLAGAGAADPDSPVAGLSDSELHEFYFERRRRERQAAAEAAAALAEIDRRRSYWREHHLFAETFVAHHTGDSPQSVARLLKVARALERMPHTSAAFGAGDIDFDRVWRLVRAHETAPDTFAGDEEILVDRARSLDARSFTGTVEIWREQQAVDVVRRDEEQRFERRRLTLSDRLDGMVHLDADLDPISAETIATAIGALAGPANRAGDDGRTAAQRRVDALSEICRRYLDSGEAPFAAAHRPHLSVIVDLDALTGSGTGRSEIGHGRTLGPAGRELLACDATVCGVLMEGPRHVMEMGRRQRTATPAQIRALAVRDGGCVVPGCDRSPDWCDAHHVIPWTHGGLTDLGNMVLVCRPHHTSHHYGYLDLPQRE